MNVLLQLMRDPHRVITRATEHFTIGDRSIISRTSLTFDTRQLEKQLTYFYVDVLHPDKGSLASVEVLTPGVTVVPHSEHRRIAEAAIRYRLATVLESMKWDSSASDSLIDATYEKLIEVVEWLITLPRSSPSKASELMGRCFSNDGGLLAIQGIQGLTVDERAVRGLRMLCNRLSTKYLLLLRVPLADGEVTVEFSTRRHYSDSKISDQGDNAIQFPARFYLFGAMPTTLRLHLPWAKRTGHYTCSLTPPKGQFIAHAAFVQRRRELPRLVELRPEAETPVSWSLDHRGGDHLAGFLGSASLYPLPLYLGVRHRELPGRSTMRMAVLALVSAVLLAVLVLLDNPSAVAGVLLAALALGAVAQPLPRADNGVPIPILSRAMPGFIGVTAGMFGLWLSLPASPWQPWNTYGGWLFVVAQLAAGLWAVARTDSLARDLRACTLNGSSSGGAFH